MIASYFICKAKFIIYIKMFSRSKLLSKFFSNSKYAEKIELLKPIINGSHPHYALNPIYKASSIPIFIGGLASLAFPAAGIFLDSVPSIVLNTMIYSSLHTSLLAGAHLGFASVIYDDRQEDLLSYYSKKQLVYPFFAPIFASFMTCAYWAFPFSHLKSLYTISSIGFIYLGVFIADNFFGDRVKIVPLWYRNLKRDVTLISVVGIILMALGVYAFPEQTKLKDPKALVKKSSS